MYGPPSRYQEYFDARLGFEMAQRFNIAPSQVVPVVRQNLDGDREFLLAKWGLLPSWVKEPEGMTRPINAKAETAALKPMFRHAFRKSRVLIPADAFFEWKLIDGKKQPYLIRMRDEAPFAMAGLLEHWQGPSGELSTFAILTTEPNPLMAKIHNRMPAIIKPVDYAQWADPKVTEVDVLQALLGPFPERLMEAFAISQKVNSPANDGPDVVEPIEL